jgi:hypothetical protein
MTRTGTGWPFRVAGLKVHVRTVRRASWSSPNRRGLATRASVTVPSGLTTMDNTTVP